MAREVCMGERREDVCVCLREREGERGREGKRAGTGDGQTETVMKGPRT